MKIVTLEMPADRAIYLREALGQYMNDWADDMDEDEVHAIESIRLALRGQLGTF